MKIEENYTFGSTRHCDRHLAVSKEWDAAAAIEPENPAARLTAKGCNGPISSSELKVANICTSVIRFNDVTIKYNYQRWTSEQIN